MKIIFHITTIITLLAGCCLNISADQLVFPPAGLPEETWTMEFYNYKEIASFYGYDQKLERNVTFVWDVNTLYIKGVFSDYPNSWIKASVNGNEIIFDSYQLICELDFIMGQLESVYGIVGSVGYDPDSGMTYGGYRITFDMKYPCYYNTFLLSNDRTAIDLKPSQLYIRKPAIWYHIKHSGLIFDEWYHDDGSVTGTGCPDVDFPIKYRFEKRTGSIGNITDDSVITDAITYDLYGRRVDSDNLRPGIYIRNGEKIMVR